MDNANTPTPVHQPPTHLRFHSFNSGTSYGSQEAQSVYLSRKEDAFHLSTSLHSGTGITSPEYTTRLGMLSAAPAAAASKSQMLFPRQRVASLASPTHPANSLSDSMVYRCIHSE